MKELHVYVLVFRCFSFSFNNISNLFYAHNIISVHLNLNLCVENANPFTSWTRLLLNEWRDMCFPHRRQYSTFSFILSSDRLIIVQFFLVESFVVFRQDSPWLKRLKAVARSIALLWGEILQMGYDGNSSVKDVGGIGFYAASSKKLCCLGCRMRRCIPVSPWLTEEELTPITLTFTES